MTATELLTWAAAAATTLAAMPLARVRRASLNILAGVARFAVFAAVSTCAAFAVEPPLAPPGWCGHAAQFLEGLHLPVPPGAASLVWLMLGGAMCVAAVPLVAHLEYARKAASLNSFLAAMRRHAATAAAAVRNSPPACGDQSDPARYASGDIAAGIAAIRAVLTASDASQPAPRPKLVRDLM